MASRNQPAAQHPEGTMLNRILRRRISRERRYENLARSEAGVLRIVRRIFHNQALVENDQMPLDQALQVDPGALGSAVPLRMLLVINAMRRARHSCFTYANPFCQCCQGRLTNEERLFIAVFRACMHEQTSLAHGHAMVLCEGGDTRDFLKHMHQLARAVGRSL
ncbi:hypothetical protein PAF17_07675 [Paracoccus sp. Z330]|uniref:Uncharacterized protein n=1 Tax=Paracoccus onchidii TaxID=3017813 RepID=A0ABT4ZFB9_9RHOB|nr:hypothetical protein [Paracoccus onchidii]MDB6177390.1 hypothetical protein [Paracoccus onchidii]